MTAPPGSPGYSTQRADALRAGDAGSILGRLAVLTLSPKT